VGPWRPAANGHLLSLSMHPPIALRFSASLKD
jgi:hypothetical protein